MELLRRMVAYNGWANTRVFERCAELDETALAQAAPGSIGSVGATLRHLIATEDAYLTLLRGRDFEAAFFGEAYLAQPFAWFVQRQAELRREYDALALQEQEAALERPLSQPCLPRPLPRAMSARDGYIQLTTHSSLHRAQVFSLLGSRSLEVPDLDYVLMLLETPA